MAGWHREIAGLTNALSFFTRIPLPASLRTSCEHAGTLNRDSAWFPVAGLIVGIAPAAVFWIASQTLPAAVAAGMALGAAAIVTGALHEDGLADCADGLGATSDRDRALEIMRDSNIGAYGVIALILSFGLRWAALAAMLPSAGAVALLIAHSAARATIATALAFTSYARKSGTATVVSQGISVSQCTLTLVIAMLIALALGGFPGLLAAACGVLSSVGFLIWLKRRIGGYTGDGLGAMEQVAEVTILIAIAGIWGPA